MKRLISLFLFITSFSAYAKTTIFCFDNGVNLSRVRKELYPMMLRGDKMEILKEKGKNCFVIDLTKNRVRYFKKFLSRSFTLLDYSSGKPINMKEINSDNYQKKYCTVKITKKEKKTSTHRLYSDAVLKLNIGKRYKKKKLLILSCEIISDEERRLHATYKSERFLLSRQERQDFSLAKKLKELINLDLGEEGDEDLSISFE